MEKLQQIEPSAWPTQETDLALELAEPESSCLGPLVCHPVAQLDWTGLQTLVTADNRAAQLDPRLTFTFW